MRKPGQTYGEAAEAAGAQIRQMNTSDMTFDIPSFEGYGATLELEPDLRTWQENVLWADHLLFVHPYWWGAMPGAAKGVLDRALVSGFGFKYKSDGGGIEKLLTGKTADGIITSDTPPWFDTLIHHKPARRVLGKQVLGFCGVKVGKMVQFGPVRSAKPEKISSWLTKAAEMGTKAAL